MDKALQLVCYEETLNIVEKSIMEEVDIILQKVVDTTLHSTLFTLEGSKYVTISEVSNVFFFCLIPRMAHLKSLKSKMSTLSNEFWKMFLEYMDKYEISDVHLTSTIQNKIVLDPRYKGYISKTFYLRS